ncbi:hypothetical protein [Phyllobacterium bourgognense]|nr:hypothetical protein [Phyllobacterium bourgognense]
MSRRHTMIIGVIALAVAIAALFWYFPMDNQPPGQTPAPQMGN